MSTFGMGDDSKFLELDYYVGGNVKTSTELNSEGVVHVDVNNTSFA